MNNYHNKYLKYKKKYFDLFNYINQKGGGSVSLLKNLNLFTKKTPQDYFLNPTLGHLYSKNFIENVFIFNSSNPYIYKLVKSSFVKNSGNPLYLNHKIIKEDSKTLARFIGRFLGYFFLKYVMDTSTLFPSVPKYPNSKIKKTFINILKENKLRSGRINTENPIDENLINPDIFGIILSILWKKSSDKSDFKEYYEGLKDAGVDIYIYDDFETDIFSPDDLDFDKSTLNRIKDENHILAIGNNYFEGTITLQQQEYTNINTSKCGVMYPDCGSTSLRNFIKILLIDYNTDSFNIDILRKLDAKQNLIDYFTIFSDDHKISSNLKVGIKIIYDSDGNIIRLKADETEKKKSARDIWGLVVSNLPYVNYLSNGCAEINSGLTKVPIDGEMIPIPNMLAVIMNLFGQINSFDDFNNINGLEFVNEGYEYDEYDEPNNSNINLNEAGYGDITFKKNNDIYRWIFDSNHYYVKNINDNKSIHPKFITNRFINKLYIHKTGNINILEFSYFKKYSNESLMEILSTNIGTIYANEDRFKHFLNYLAKNLNQDELSRIDYYINLVGLVKGFSTMEELEITTTNGLQLREILNNFPNLKNLIITVNNINLEDSLNHLTKLEELIVDKISGELGNSLDKLTNLKKLELFDYDKPLKDSLKKLTNLEYLTIVSKFNHKLNNHLDNLKNLNYLNLGNDFNQELTYVNNGITKSSLEKLKNLKQIDFGENFNKPLGNALQNLTELEIINFSDSFNQPLNNSFKKLIKLRKISFGVNFNQPLNNSLENQLKLKELKFGFYYEQPVGDSFKYLTNLTDLIVFSRFKISFDLVKSLPKLKNLTISVIDRELRRKIKHELPHIKIIDDKKKYGRRRRRYDD